jgi:hypothetical protein
MAATSLSPWRGNRNVANAVNAKDRTALPSPAAADIVCCPAPATHSPTCPLAHAGMASAFRPRRCTTGANVAATRSRRKRSGVHTCTPDAHAVTCLCRRRTSNPPSINITPHTSA